MDTPRSPAPDGPYAVHHPDGYCRYACPECGAVLETTLPVRAVRARCYKGWQDIHHQERGCNGEVRDFLPVPPPHTAEEC